MRSFPFWFLSSCQVARKVSVYNEGCHLHTFHLRFPHSSTSVLAYFHLVIMKISRFYVTLLCAFACQIVKPSELKSMLQESGLSQLDQELSDLSVKDRVMLLSGSIQLFEEKDPQAVARFLSSLRTYSLEVLEDALVLRSGASERSIGISQALLFLAAWDAIKHHGAEEVRVPRACLHELSRRIPDNLVAKNTLLAPYLKDLRARLYENAAAVNPDEVCSTLMNLEGVRQE